MKNILIIGAGHVGAHIAQQGIAKNLAAHFYLSDLNDEACAAQVLDLKDTLLFSTQPKVDCLSLPSPKVAEMDAVIITAGANQEPGETRVDLLNKNSKLLQSIANSLQELPSHCVIILVTNPVDIITKIAQEIFNLPTEQIIGSGTILDSARLRWRISERLGINVKNVHGAVLGEHGDSEFVAWSTVTSSDTFDTEEKEQIESAVRNEAYEIIQGKGATYFGIGGATIKLLTAIINDTKEVMPVSTNCPELKDGLDQTPLGVPAVIGKKGVERVLPLRLNEAELERLTSSAQKLKTLFEEM